ncbi:MAG TPA: cellulase family glycosylhydrolase, partial [Polyangiaceae bacterium]
GGASGGTDAGISVGGDLGCPKFASGVNVAWIKFGNDVPNPNIAAFTTLFQNVRAAGGHIVRWWLHANGLVTPGYDGSGFALPISDANIADIKKVLDAAAANGVMINLSLWSFDMLQTGAARVLPQNNALLTQDINRQKYIDNVLTPLVNALKGHPGLYSWETFNEPEGMTTQHGFVPVANRIDERFIQITVNWFADAIHNADPNALVTNAAWQFLANSTVPPRSASYYTDAALLAAGGRAKGTLDFYEIHYYMSNGTAVSPFVHPASYFQLDKRAVIGEFWALDTDGVTAANLYTTLYNNGYNGAWAWQYQNNDNATSSTKWPAMQVPMQNLLAAHPADLTCP